jgi:transposase InsO family protein
MKTYDQEFSLTAMCEALEISRSGYYEGLAASTGVRAEQNQRLTSAIVRIHQESRCNYGSPRILDALHGEDWQCGVNRVARIMREEAIVGKCPRRKRVVTTQSNHGHSASPNLIKGLSAQRPDEIWVMDITYIRIRHPQNPATHQWVYLATVLDLYSRKIVGWQVGPSLEATLAIEALENALSTRDWQPGLICHSDRGVQYACGDFRALLELHGIIQSMSAKGNCYDNATMESFFGTLKTEEVESTGYADLPEARRALFDYIESFYNRTRLHTSLKGALAEVNSSSPSSSSDTRVLACSPEQLESAYHRSLQCAHQDKTEETRPSAMEFSKASDALPVDAIASASKAPLPGALDSGAASERPDRQPADTKTAPVATTVCRIIPSNPQKVALQQSLPPLPQDPSTKSCVEHLHNKKE